ncbi:MAG: peptidoglycan-binding domain-containing protein [Devosia sp.]
MTPYRFGTRSAETLALQRMLADRGAYGGPIDGIYGRQTRQAVVASRAALGLGPGDVDQALLAALRDPLASGPLRGVLGRLALLLFPSLMKGLSPMNFLAGYRTYVVAAAMLVAGVAGLLGIDIPNFTGQAPGTLVMEALAFIFLRQGLKTDLTKS